MTGVSLYIYMILRIDFLDLKDTSSKLSSLCTDYGAVHVGIRLDDKYLLPLKNQKTVWRDYSTFDRLIKGKIYSSYLILPATTDPAVLFIIGSDRIISPFWYRFITEFPHYFADAGLRIKKPKRSTCIDIAKDMLVYLDIPVVSTTARHLDNELERLSWIPGSGVAST